MSYPVYRKLDGFDRFYKIESADLFIEASFRQGKIHYESVKAVQFPEKLRIQDMISCAFSYVEMTPEEIADYFQ